MSPEEAVKRCQAGDAQAFEAVFTHYRPLMTHYVKRFLRDRDDIEDVVQATFIKAYQKITHYNPRQALSTWLYAIARHTAIDALRHRECAACANQARAEVAVTDNAIHPDVAMALLSDALSRVSIRESRLLKMRYLEGAPYPRIAQQLGVSEDAARVRSYRARQRLKLALSEHANLP